MAMNQSDFAEALAEALRHALPLARSGVEWSLEEDPNHSQREPGPDADLVALDHAESLLAQWDAR